MAGRAVTTIEGLTPAGTPHPVQTALVAAGATQCGYCTPGMVLTAAALLEKQPDPDDTQIIRALDGNICRCCAYPRILRAVRAAARRADTAEQAPAARPGEARPTQESERLPQGALPTAAAPAPGAAAAAGSSGPSGPGVSEADAVPTWASAVPAWASAVPAWASAVPAWASAVPAWASAVPAQAAAVPWDLQPPEERGYFGVLSDGLVSVLPPAPSGRQEPWRGNGGVWIHVGADGTVTAFAGKVDVGQDNGTAFAMLVAEELGVPLPAVRMVLGDTDLCPFDIGTFGSRSMPDTGQALATAAAAARQALIALAASALEVDPGQLGATAGAVKDNSTGTAVSYADLLRGVRQTVTAAADTPPGTARPGVRPASRR